MSDTDIPTEIVELIDADLAMYRMRLQGISTRQLAKQFKCSEKRVKEAVARMCEPITAMSRAEMLTIELARLEELQFAHYEAATKGDVPATMVLKWIAEHRAAIGGLYAAVAVRSDPYQLIEQGKQPSTTDRIEAALNALAKPRPIDVDQASPDDADDEGAREEVAKATNPAAHLGLSGTDAEPAAPANGSPAEAAKDKTS
jgi:DNA-binding CsgD family transcriptional regulator